MYGCDRCTLNKTEHKRIDTFELWCWRLLRVHRTAWGPTTPWFENHQIHIPWIFKKSTLNIHWKDRWSWSSNPLATWCKYLTHWKKSWFWKRLRAVGEGMTEDEMFEWHHWLNGHEYEQILRETWYATVHRAAKNQSWLSDWTFFFNILFSIFVNRLTWITLKMCLKILKSGSTK